MTAGRIKRKIESIAGSSLHTLIRKRWSGFFLISAVSGIASLSTVVLPWASKSIVDVISSGFSWPEFLWGVALLFGALVLRSAVGGCASFAATKIQLRLLREILELIHSRLLKIPYQKIKKFQSGLLTSHTLNDAQLLVAGFGYAINALIRYPVELISLVVFIGTIDLAVSGLVLVAMVSIGLFSHWKSRKSGQLFSRAIKYNASLFALVNENIGLNKIIRLFNRQEHRLDRFRRQSQDFQQGQLSYMLQRLKLSVASDIAAGVFVVLGLLYAGHKAATGRFTPGQGAAIIVALVALSGSLHRLSGTWVELRSSLSAGQFVRELLMATSPEATAELKKDRREPISSVEFRNVRFGYDQDEILKDVNLRLFPGRPTILVGNNGAGKSTLVELLFRLYEPSSGSILINGRDLRQVPLGKILSSMTLIPQDASLFHDSIRYNILFGKPEANPEELDEIVRKARLDLVLQEKKCTLDYQVGDQGSFLSPGERQRIALARAFLPSPDVLICDEPTNNLDPDSQNIIWKLISEYSKDRIVLVITQTDIPKHLEVRCFRLESGRIFPVLESQLEESAR